MTSSRASLASAIALAACSFALPASFDGDTIEMQLTPAGEFRPSDGRQLDVPAWRIDAAIAARVIAARQARKTPPVIDYEHQTLHKEENGQPAPAAGWIGELVWREGQGLFAQVKLTARAREYIAAGEYLYVSPVFTYDRKTGDVLSIEMAAITNSPALDGLAPLEARAAATFCHTDPTEEPAMHKSALFTAVVAALALGANATEEQAIAALTNVQAQLAERDQLLQALGIKTDATTPEQRVAVCTSLRQKAEGAGEPDPAKYVPVAVVTELQTSLAALTAQVQGKEVEQLVEQGLADGRLLPAQRDWATSLGKKDIAALTAYLDSAQPIAALRGTQTQGADPTKDPKNHGLTADELAVCSATGIAPEVFAKTKGGAGAAAA